MTTITAPAKPAEELREEWVRDVTDLMGTVSVWAREWLRSRGWTPAQGWGVRETYERRVTRVPEDVRALPVLEINAPPDRQADVPEERLVLEPIAFLVAGAKERVDFYAYPGLPRVMLLRQPGGWVVRTDSGINWPHPWNQTTFVELAEALLDAS